MNPKVSTVLPTYNREKQLPRAIDSVLNQTYDDFELIIVDDGSQDDTATVVAGYSDNRIKYINFPHNRGGNAARNAGIKLARGEYVAFQDSDDEWLLDKLEKQVSALDSSNNNVGALYSDFIRINGDNVEKDLLKDINPKSGIITETLMRRRFIGTQTLIVKKSVFDKVGAFDEQLFRRQDWELCLRISTTYEFLFITEPLVNVYVSSNSISLNIKKDIAAVTYILKKYRDLFQKYKTSRIEHYSQLRGMLAQESRGLEARKYSLLLFIDQPKLKNLLIGVFGYNEFHYLLDLSKSLFHKKETSV